MQSSQKKKKLVSLFLIITILATCTILGSTFFSKAASPGFYVSDGVLKDANGNDFVIRGINNPHIWYDGPAYDALKAISDTKSNAVRIVWQTNGSPQRLEQIIKRCIELNMIPIPELHDASGKDDVSFLKNCLNYWTREDVKTVLNKYRKYIILNIANECIGTWNKHEDWAAAYKEAVSVLRKSGIEHTLMIDTSGWGQEWASVAKYGKEIFENDKLKNTIFSIHMYGCFGTKEKVENCIHTLIQNKIPFVVGEFGWNHSDGDVDEYSIMKECTDHNIGYIAWSWKGNTGGVEYLDLSYDWNNADNLTEWGKTAILSQYGIKATSKTCSIFNSSSTAPEISTSPKITTPSSNPSDNEGSNNKFSIEYFVRNQWNDGATIEVTIKNLDSKPINNWELKWSFKNNETIRDLWCASFTQTGNTVTANSLDWNSVIQPNSSVTFGFNINYSGTITKPDNFILNGSSSNTDAVTNTPSTSNNNSQPNNNQYPTTSPSENSNGTNSNNSSSTTVSLGDVYFKGVSVSGFVGPNELTNKASSLSKAEVKKSLIMQIDEHWDLLSKELSFGNLKFTNKEKMYALFIGWATRESTLDAGLETATDYNGRPLTNWGQNAAHAYGPLQTAETAFRNNIDAYVKEDNVPEMIQYELNSTNFFDLGISNHMGLRKIVHFARLVKDPANTNGVAYSDLDKLRHTIVAFNTGWVTPCDEGWLKKYTDEIAALGKWYGTNNHLTDNEYTWTDDPKVDRNNPWDWYFK